MELLTFCSTSTYVMGLGQIYQQKEGFAMGSPVSPLASNIYMEWFKTHALATAPHANYRKPTHIDQYLLMD